MDVEYPGTLAALAMTCKVIYEPALDVLWSSLVSRTPPFDDATRFMGGQNCRKPGILKYTVLRVD